jgi:hypothetical protein
MLSYCLDFCAELFDKWGKHLIFIGLAGESDIAGNNHDDMVYLESLSDTQPRPQRA